MVLARNALGFKSAAIALLCVVGVGWVSVILCHEFSVIFNSQILENSDILNSTKTCIESTAITSYRSITVENVWCLVRQTAASDFVHHMIGDVLKRCDKNTLTAFYNYYLLGIFATGTLLSIILLQSIDPFIKQLAPLFIVYSFLTWQPVLIIILSLLCCKVLKAGSGVLPILISQPWLLAFLALAAFKFLKVFVHTVSFYLLTNPAQQLVNPSLYPGDVTVIVPSVGEFDDEFVECIETIIANRPHKVVVCTVGMAKWVKAKEVTTMLNSRHPDANITVLSILEANKRAQFFHALEEVDTAITAYADDHVFWPPTYLRSSLAPFEDQRVGIVGTVKKVRRDRSGGFWRSFMNYIACLYLERHNFECTASYNLDGGVFVISGRTALVRTNIVQHVDFRQEFLNETWWWGKVGPLKVDDDNCITRWMVKHGWKTVFHNSPDAVLETTLGTTGGLQKFRGQLIRWVRTTWRSNSTSLFSERTCWVVHPWTTYAMFFSSFVNIALIYDPLLILTLYRSGYTQHMYSLLIALLVSKLIKPIEHLRREPQDIMLMLPLGLVFGYVHSLFKIWAFFTAGNIEWSGRKGIK